MRENKIIDMHVHLANYKIYPKYWRKGVMSKMYDMLKGNPEADRIVEKMVQNSLGDFTGDKMIRSMDQAGIEKSVVVMADFGYVSNDSDFTLNELYEEHYKTMEKNSSRLVLLGGCDPRRGKEGFQLFEQAVRQHKVKGLKLYPPCGFELDDTRLEPFYELCNEYEMPVLIHIGPSLENMKKEFHFPESIKPALKKYTKASFVLGHGAVQQFEVCKELPLEYPNAYLELSGFQSYMKDINSVEEKLDDIYQHYKNNILFGSDWPMFNSQGKAVEMIEGLKQIPDDWKSDIFYENAKKLLDKIKL